MGLTVSLTIDPSSVMGPPSPPASSSPPAPDPPSPPSSPPSSNAPVSTQSAPVADRAVVRPSPAPAQVPVRAHAGLAVMASIGAEPSPSPGAAVFVGASWRFVSFDLELRGDLPSSTTSDGSVTQVQSYVIAGGIVPCAHYAFAYACPVLVAGQLTATSLGTTSPKEASDLWLGAGGRVGLEQDLGGPWSLRAYGEMLGTVRRDTLAIGGASAYVYPPASGGVGLGLALRFL
jgi:hypothetical protein